MKKRPALFVFADGHTERHNVDAEFPEVWSIARHIGAPPPFASDKPAPPGRVVTFELVRQVERGTTYVHYRERVPRTRKAVGFVYKDGSTEVREVPWPPDLRHTVKRKRLTAADYAIHEESLTFYLSTGGPSVHYREDGKP